MDLIQQMLQKHPDLAPSVPGLIQATDLLETCFLSGGKLLLCGNGGSAADCEHIAGELMKGFNLKRPVLPDLRARLGELYPQQGDYLANHLQRALPTISLVSQSALMTAFINDVAADMVFAQQVLGYGRPGDVLLGLTTSGNSTNVLNALRVGRALNVQTIGLTGRNGGAINPLCDVLITVPEDQTPNIQQAHQVIYHTLCALLEERFFGK